MDGFFERHGVQRRCYKATIEPEGACVETRGGGVERWWGRGEGRIAHEGNERIEPASYSGVVVWECGVPLMEEWSWTGGELVVGARGFGGGLKSEAFGG